MQALTASLAPSRRPALWLVGVVLAAMIGAQWLALRHTHGADGLALECQVCEHAPAFAHAVASVAPALPAPAAAPLSAARTLVTQGRRAPTARARGPPASVPY